MPKRTYFRETPPAAPRPIKERGGGGSAPKNDPLCALKFFGSVILFSGVLSFLALVLVLFYFLKDLPDPQSLVSMREVAESTKIYDRTGAVLLYDIYGEERRTVIPFSKMNDWVKKATIAAEDADFYKHRGFDVRGIGRAVIRNIFNFNNQSLQGGSTITQQLVKNSFLTAEKTFSRKIREFLLALAIENKYSKDEILELYLNQIPYGNNAYGIEAAANVYFNKRASELSLAQAAYLAALPQAPSYYSPYGNRREELESRKSYILERMKKLGFIGDEDFQKAQNEEIDFMTSHSKILAPHFVMFVREELNKKYGEKYIETAGLKIITTLDFKLQGLAEEIVKKGALENENKYNAKNAALVAQDPKTGQILAMVGSRDYWEEESKPKGCAPGKSCQFEPYTNVALRERQPGSAFKPFAYATAFKKGFAPDTVLFDLKTEFHPGCDPDGKPKTIGVRPEDCYRPSNYDDKFRGPVTMRQALAQSLNVPSVKTLYLAGIDETINFSQEMGITTLRERNRYGLSLVLGGGEVKLVDMVDAYSVFANDGIKNPPAFILKIEDSKGNVLEEYSQKASRVLDAEIARLISDILSDDNARSPVFQRNSPLFFNDREVAAKTGTTQYYRDAWVIGYTPTLSVGVWVGNNDNTSMDKGGAGIMAAGPIWHQFLTEALAGVDSGTFKKPQPVLASKSIHSGRYVYENKIEINKLTGEIAGPETPKEQIGEMVFPEIHSILYWLSKDDPSGPQPENPADDPQFANWETAVLNWVKLLPNSAIYNQEIPSVLDPRNFPKITIASPKNETRITVPTFILETIIEAPLGAKQVNFYLDGEYLGSKIKEPYLMEISLKKELGSQYWLRAEIVDSENNKNSSEITVFR